MTKLLHFSLGPVQDFIAQARRTRDLWAGSFLLSWLSGRAMVALTEAGGVIQFPDVEHDTLFQGLLRVQKGNSAGEAPFIGSLPNRFKAEVGAVDGDAGALCAKAVQDAWRSLGDAVYRQFIAKTVEDLGKGTRAIWDRQVDGYWRTTWVLGAPEWSAADPNRPMDGTWLALRKSWRPPLSSSVEAGDLCRMMGRYQEVSGHARLGARDKQVAFYNALREQRYTRPGSSAQDAPRLGPLNIGEDERLCAIALIKRLFPLLNDIEEKIGWRPGWTGRGERAINVINWPSSSYVAALPWLRAVSGTDAMEARTAFAVEAEDCLASGHRGETETRLFGLSSGDPFFALDGPLFHEEGIRALDDKQIKKDAQGARQGLLARLKPLNEAAAGDRNADKAARGESASTFYGLLLMDGDRVGSRLDKAPETIKRGLAGFTEKVRAYFDPAGCQKNPADGVLIYAGGDDVLALVPLTTALDAARAVRRFYTEAFDAARQAVPTEREETKEPFTLSGGLIFAQYKIPFRIVLEKAHHLLDRVAKDHNGRDSLGLAVLKPGGLTAQWVGCWDEDQLQALQDIARDRSDYSSSFLYNIRDRYAALFEDPVVRSEDAPAGRGVLEDRVPQEFADPEVMEAVLTAEYTRQPGKKIPSADQVEWALQVERALDRLTQIGFPAYRLEEGDARRTAQSYCFDGALIARFLAGEGPWSDKEADKEAGDVDGPSGEIPS